MANCAEYAPPARASRRRHSLPPAGNQAPAKVLHGATPALTAFDRARIEGLIARLIDLLDAHDAPSADMEPDWDHEADADAERSLQPLPLEPRPFPGWAALEAAGLAERVVVPHHGEAKPGLAEGKVVSHRRGSKPRRTVIEGEVVR